VTHDLQRDDPGACHVTSRAQGRVGHLAVDASVFVCVL
jgi:hypothetical protein